MPRNSSRCLTITEWKWVTAWPEPDLYNASDYDFTVFNDCLTGNRTSIASDQGYNLRGRIRLAGNEIGGRCLRMCIYGYNASTVHTIVSSDYFHSGSTSTH